MPAVNQFNGFGGGAYKETPKYLVEVKDRIENVFPEKSAKILLMHEMYKK